MYQCCSFTTWSSVVYSPLQIVVSPHSEVDIPVLFYPSSVGSKGHEAELAFISCEVFAINLKKH